MRAVIKPISGNLMMNNIKTIKAIIFDLDGTIADTLPLCIAAFKKSIEPLLGKSLSHQEITDTFGPSEEGTIRSLIPDHEEAGVNAYLQHYQELHYTCPVPFPGIEALLTKLQAKSIKLGMFTGKGLHSTRISLQQFGLAEYFETLQTGSPHGPNKVKGIQDVLQQLGVSASESLYIGDAPSDIHFSKEVGIPVVAAAWAGTADAETLQSLQPNALFISVEDFTKWIMAKVDAAV